MIADTPSLGNQCFCYLRGVLVSGYIATRDQFDWGAVHAAFRVQLSFREFRAVQAVASIHAAIDKADFDGIIICIWQRG